MRIRMRPFRTTTLRKLSEHLRRKPNATAAQALAEFRRLLADKTAQEGRECDQAEDRRAK